MKRRRILVVDDHPIVCRGIRDLLGQEPDLEVCAEADNGVDALKAIREHDPDAIIVDISLKGRDGLELTKSIRAHDWHMPILVMSMHDEGVYAERVLRAGANGYIMKHEVPERMVEAVRQVLRGDVYVSESLRQRILHGLGSGGLDPRTSSLEALSDRELEVFRLIGKGRTTRQVAEALHLSVKTIETYRAHIKDKLGLATGTDLVRRAVQWTEGEEEPGTQGA